ncbi:hypothetical protein PINS_up021593, partial [Pythium insidiosum]
MATSPSASPSPLRFQTWQSAPDVSFWQRLAALKLDRFQLNDDSQPITAFFTPGRSSNVPARLTVDSSSFSADDAAVDRARYEWKAPGSLLNTNTLDAFKVIDKNAVLRTAGQRVLNAIRRLIDPSDDDAVGSAVEELNTFVLLTFADLKKHSFIYWFGFPAIALPSSVNAHAPVCVES